MPPIFDKLKLLEPGHINIQHESAEEALAHLKTSEVIYLDPARRNVGQKKYFNLTIAPLIFSLYSPS